MLFSPPEEAAKRAVDVVPRVVGLILGLGDTLCRKEDWKGEAVVVVLGAGGRDRDDDGNGSRNASVRHVIRVRTPPAAAAAAAMLDGILMPSLFLSRRLSCHLCPVG